MSINFKQFEKMKWKRVWARDYCLLLGYYYSNAFGEKNPLLVCKNKLFLPERNLYASYMDEQELRKLINIFTARLLKTDLKKYSSEFESIFRSSVKWAKKLASGNFKQLSNRRLADRVRQFHKYFQPYTTAQYTAFVVLEGPGRQVEEFVKSYKNSREILGWIAAPYKLTKITKARLELLDMVKRKKTARIDLITYAKKYAWLPLNDLTHQPLEYKDVLKETASIINPEKEILSVLYSSKSNLQNYAKFLSSLKDK